MPSMSRVLKGGLLLTGLVFVAISCHKSSPAEPPSKSPEYFPNAIGDRWKYALTDSIARASDTVQVIVTDTVHRILLSDSEFATVWRYNYHDHTDSQYVNFHNDTVNIFSGNWSDTYLIIPFHVGQKWGRSDPLNEDSTEVVALDSITVPGGSFKTAYFIRRRKLQQGPVAEWDTETWFVPTVGSVWIHQHSAGIGGFFDRTWVLLSYGLMK